MTPEERSMRARMASYASWANCHDPAERTRKARDSFMQRFLREVDPEGKLPTEERLRRAEAAKKAYFSRLAYRSARARRKR